MTLDLEIITWGAVMSIFLSAFIHGTFGFGFPLVSTPLLTIIFDLKTAILLTIVPTIFNNVLNIANEKGILDSRKGLLTLSSSGFFGSYLGTEMIINFRPEPFKILLGLLLIFYGIFSLTRAKFSKFKLERTFRKDLVFGFAAGLIGGTMNIMLAPLLIYMTLIHKSKSETIVTMNFCFLVGKIAQFVTYWAYGEINAKFFVNSVMVIVFLVPGALVGIYLRNRFDTNMYRKYLLYAVVGAGVFILILACVEIFQLRY